MTRPGGRLFQTEALERASAELRALRRAKRKPFKLVLADPATRFRTWSLKGEGKSPQRHYSTLDIGIIAAMPVAELVGDDAVLALWWTWPHIFDAKRVIEGWGFKYSGLLWEWDKFNPVTNKRAFGGGYGTRKNFEPCLLARRGRLNIKTRKEIDLIRAPRREHSRKPDEQYERLERMFDGPYLEMFARTERPGWTAWGDEKGRFASEAALIRKDG